MRTALGQLHWYSVLASVAAAMAGGACMMLAWRAVLADLGSRLPVRAAVRVNFLAPARQVRPRRGLVRRGDGRAGTRQGRSAPPGRRLHRDRTGDQLAVGLAIAAVTLPLASSAAARHYRWIARRHPAHRRLPVPARSRQAGRPGPDPRVRMQPLERRPTLRGLVSALRWTALGWLFLGFQVWVVHDGVTSRYADSTRSCSRWGLRAGLLGRASCWSSSPAASARVTSFSSRRAPPSCRTAPRWRSPWSPGPRTTASDLAWGAIALAIGRSRPALGSPRRRGLHRRPAEELVPVRVGRVEPAASRRARHRHALLIISRRQGLISHDAITVRTMFNEKTCPKAEITDISLERLGPQNQLLFGSRPGIS